MHYFFFVICLSDDTVAVTFSIVQPLYLWWWMTFSHQHTIAEGIERTYRSSLLVSPEWIRLFLGGKKHKHRAVQLWPLLRTLRSSNIESPTTLEYIRHKRENTLRRSSTHFKFFNEQNWFFEYDCARWFAGFVRYKTQTAYIQPFLVYIFFTQTPAAQHPRESLTIDQISRQPVCRGCDLYRYNTYIYIYISIICGNLRQNSEMF